MDLGKKRIDSLASKAYAPYYKESLHCFQVFLLVSAIILIVYVTFGIATTNNTLHFYVMIEVCYILMDSALNHRLTFLSLYEKRNKKWEELEISIREIKDELSFSNHILESVIPKLYSPNLRVGKYKLNCLTKDNQRISLRIVMSGKKYQIIQDRIFKSLPTNCTVICGKYSKIIIFFKSSELWTDKLNHMF